MKVTRHGSGSDVQWEVLFPELENELPTLLAEGGEVLSIENRGAAAGCDVNIRLKRPFRLEGRDGDTGDKLLVHFDGPVTYGVRHLRLSAPQAESGAYPADGSDVISIRVFLYFFSRLPETEQLTLDDIRELFRELGRRMNIGWAGGR